MHSNIYVGKGYILLQLHNPTNLFIVSATAMLKKPVVTEVRTPTNTWSGLGFSKSMPAETIKELRRANHVSYKPTMSTTYEVYHLSWVLTLVLTPKKSIVKSLHESVIPGFKTLNGFSSKLCLKNIILPNFAKYPCVGLLNYHVFRIFILWIAIAFFLECNKSTLCYKYKKIFRWLIIPHLGPG